MTSLCSPAGGVSSCDLLPDYGSHVVHADSLAKFGYLGSNRDNLVAPIIDRARKLVNYVYAKAATLIEDSEAFAPHQIEIVDVIFIRIVESQLVFVPVVFELPVGW